MSVLTRKEFLVDAVKAVGGLVLLGHDIVLPRSAMADTSPKGVQIPSDKLAETEQEKRIMSSFAPGVYEVDPKKDHDVYKVIDDIWKNIPRTLSEADIPPKPRLYVCDDDMIMAVAFSLQNKDPDKINYFSGGNSTAMLISRKTLAACDGNAGQLRAVLSHEAGHILMAFNPGLQKQYTPAEDSPLQARFDKELANAGIAADDATVRNAYMNEVGADVIGRTLTPKPDDFIAFFKTAERYQKMDDDKEVAANRAAIEKKSGKTSLTPEEEQQAREAVVKDFNEAMHASPHPSTPLREEMMRMPLAQLKSSPATQPVVPTVIHRGANPGPAR